MRDQSFDERARPAVAEWLRSELCGVVGVAEERMELLSLRCEHQIRALTSPVVAPVRHCHERRLGARGESRIEVGGGSALRPAG